MAAGDGGERRTPWRGEEEDASGERCGCEGGGTEGVKDGEMGLRKLGWQMAKRELGIQS